MDNDRAVKIKNQTSDANDTASTSGMLELDASTDSNGKIGNKFVGVMGTITNVKKLEETTLILGTVTVTIEDNSPESEGE